MWSLNFFLICFLLEALVVIFFSFFFIFFCVLMKKQCFSNLFWSLCDCLLGNKKRINAKFYWSDGGVSGEVSCYHFKWRVKRNFSRFAQIVLWTREKKKRAHTKHYIYQCWLLLLFWFSASYFCVSTMKNRRRG